MLVIKVILFLMSMAILVKINILQRCNDVKSCVEDKKIPFHLFKKAMSEALLSQ